jgi:predicted DNA binding CopG/RHH family protein
MNKKSPIPAFQSEGEEQEFWDEHDSTEYVEGRDARPVVLGNLQPSTKTISLRLPEYLLEALKLLANKRDVPYQSLLKVFLAERVEAELKGTRGTPGRQQSRRDRTRG